MPTNAIVPLQKTSEYIKDSASFSHDDLSELESLIVVLVNTQQRITISRLVLLVRTNKVSPMPFVSAVHIARAVEALAKLKYIQYQLVEY